MAELADPVYGFMAGFRSVKQRWFIESIADNLPKIYIYIFGCKLFNII